MMAEKIVRLWKCVPKGMVSHGHKWRVGTWYTYDGELKLCECGFHAFALLPDAFWFVSPVNVCAVSVRGEVLQDTDKWCVREMRIDRVYRWTKRDSVEFACWCARRVLPLFEKENPADSRPRKAIRAAEAWFKNPTKKNAAASRAAAGAAWAAWAAGAARAAAGAEKKAQHKKILTMLKKKEG